MQKALALIHAPFEKLGAISTWCESKAIEIVEVHTYKGDTLPSLMNFDFLFVMGGPQSVNQEEIYPYLTAEMALIREAIQSHKHVFGVCLGAQLIAKALGAAALKSPEREIGIFPIMLTPRGIKDPALSGIPEHVWVSHWHYDMPGLPEGAEILAESLGCPRQIIRFGKRVLGTQCHFELTADLIAEMAQHCPQDFLPGLFIQDLDSFVKADFIRINHYLHIILDQWIADEKEELEISISYSQSHT